MFDRRAEREALAADQLASLRYLCGELVKGNDYYGPILKDAGLGDGVESIEDFVGKCPFTTKGEIVADQERHGPFGRNQTYALDRYTRFHQTSGTTANPMRWLDTEESWGWMVGNWQRVYKGAGVGRGDRVFFAFSFGPFLGFWTAFEAAEGLGCLCLPGGGMSSEARLKMMAECKANVLCCTPTYAMRLADVGAGSGIDVAGIGVKVVVVAGEPGGSVKAVRERISEAWGGARVYDHHGMTEVGPVSYECQKMSGILRLMERGYLVEVVDQENGEAVEDGEVGELVLTTLGRVASPLLRYRTGDLVKVLAEDRDEGEVADVGLEGGILGRADDMLLVRGVNVFPSAVDEIVMGVGGVAEYRVEVEERDAMVEMKVTVEPCEDRVGDDGLRSEVEGALRGALSLRVPVEVVEVGALPRFEMKANRWVRC